MCIGAQHGRADYTISARKKERAGIYPAVIRNFVEFHDGPVDVWTRLYANADEAAER